MILNKILKYLTFTLIVLFTINNIASNNVNNNFKIKTILATKPFDIIIANDIKTLTGLRDSSDSMINFASMLYKIDKKINIIDLQKEYIIIKRAYIYNKDLNSYLIECDITLYQTFEKIEKCNYNQKIYSKLKEVAQQGKENSINNKIGQVKTEQEYSNKLIVAVIEKLLTFKFYENYLTYYLKDIGIDNPKKNIKNALSILEYNQQSVDFGELTTNEIKTDNLYIAKKSFKYTYQLYSCETKVENVLLLLSKELRERAPLNSPPITISTTCEKNI
jgi:hypothetical protein